MHEPRQPRLTVIGYRTGLPHPGRAYDYHGTGHDVIDPANCACDENGGRPCKHAIAARKQNPGWRKAATA